MTATGLGFSHDPDVIGLALRDANISIIAVEQFVGIEFEPEFYHALVADLALKLLAMKPVLIEKGEGSLCLMYQPVTGCGLI